MGKTFFERTIFVFVNIYYPPDRSDEDALADHILDSTNLLMEKFPKAIFVVCGDLNQFEIAKIEQFSHYSELFSAATRGAAQLDRVLCTTPAVIAKVDVINTSVRTDHLAILCHHIVKRRPQKRFVRFQDQRLHKRLSFGIALGDTAWDTVLSEEDPDKIVEKVNNEIYAYLNVCCPQRKIKLTEKDPIYYMSPLLKVLLKLRYTYSKRKRHNQEEALSVRIREMIKRNLQRGKQNTKAWWTHVNKLLG